MNLQTKIALSMELLSSTSWSIFHEERPNCLLLEWQGKQNNAVYRAALESLLIFQGEMADEFLCIDERDLAPVTEECQNWFQTVWLPKVKQTNVKKLAILVSEQAFLTLPIEETKSLTNGLLIQYFHTMQNVQTWFIQ